MVTVILLTNDGCTHGGTRRSVSLLGGVVNNEEIIQIQKIPVLGDMPDVGSLFICTVNINKKVETLVFITPRILSGVSLD